MSDYIGPVEAARILGVTYNRVWQLANKRMLPFVWEDFSRKFRREDVEKFRDNRSLTRLPSPKGDSLLAEVVEAAGQVSELAGAYQKARAKATTLKTAWYTDNRLEKLDEAWAELESLGGALFQAHVEYRSAFDALNQSKTLVRPKGA